jgi:hypothetical protein
MRPGPFFQGFVFLRDFLGHCCPVTVTLSPIFAIAAVLQESSRRNWIALGLNVAMLIVILVLAATR